jgi:hypothetical protein
MDRKITGKLMDKKIVLCYDKKLKYSWALLLHLANSSFLSFSDIYSRAMSPWLYLYTFLVLLPIQVLSSLVMLKWLTVWHSLVVSYNLQGCLTFYTCATFQIFLIRCVLKNYFLFVMDVCNTIIQYFSKAWYWKK